MDNKKYKRRWGDKKDGRLIRGEELDTNHFVMPIVWPSRTENEAYINEVIDLTNTEKYLEEKNKGLGSERYSLFMLILAAIGKVFINRPKMNRFYRKQRLYERYETSIGFIVKKELSDDGAETLCKIVIEPTDTLEEVSEKIREKIKEGRSEKIDKSSDDLRILMKFPFFIGKAILNFFRWLDQRTSIPKSVSASDLFFNSIVVSNLGSIKLHAGYHHLSNWGTNSFFMTIGERTIRPFYDKKGNMTLKPSIDLGMTIDERIADGFYYSKSIRLFKYYLMNPQELEKQFKEN